MIQGNSDKYSMVLAPEETYRPMEQNKGPWSKSRLLWPPNL